jgi:hypothetical protein
MAFRRSALLVLVSLCTLCLVRAQEEPKEEELKPQTPSDSMREFVAVLATKDAWKAEQAFFISKETYAKTFPTSVPPYAQAQTRYRQGIKAFMEQDLPIEKMEFVRIDYQYCPEPLLLPKGFRGLRAMCIMYDNLHVIVRIEGKLYTFKVDELIPDGKRWSTLGGIRTLKPHHE